MNILIQNLYKQAGGYIEVDDQGNRLTYSHDLDPEEFARLIIEECNRYACGTWEHGQLLGGDLKVLFGFAPLEEK